MAGTVSHTRKVASFVSYDFPKRLDALYTSASTFSEVEKPRFWPQSSRIYKLSLTPFPLASSILTPNLLEGRVLTRLIFTEGPRKWHFNLTRDSEKEKKSRENDC